MVQHKIQLFRALPRYYGGNGDEHRSIKLEARAAAYAELATYMENGVTYYVIKFEEIRKSNADDEDTFGIFVVTLIISIAIDHLL